MAHQSPRRRAHAIVMGFVVAALAVAVAAPAAVAGSAKTKRVSVSSGGAQANGSSEGTSISANGRYVAFESAASNLVGSDSNGKSDVFVYDRLTKKTKRISRKKGGGDANGNSYSPSISASGRFVAFESSASDLIGVDTNDKLDVYVYDRKRKKAKRVSVTTAGSQVTGGNSVGPSISADGRYVAFVSFASDVVDGDANSESDVFVHDRKTKKTKRVSVRTNGVGADDSSGSAAISANGRFVAFDSIAENLVGGDTNSHRDVFVRDLLKKRTKRVSVRSNGAQTTDDSRGPSISANGRYVAFASEAIDLVKGDSNGEFDVFVRDRKAKKTKRVNRRSNGAQAKNGASGDAAISANGRWVVFESDATNLVKGDSNGETDIFVHDRTSKKTKRASVRKNGKQTLKGGSDTPAISGDGRFVGFYSDATDLVPKDTNDEDDVFLRGPLR